MSQDATPRTDAKYEETINGDCLPGCDSHAHEEMCPYCNPDAVMADFARQLERELSAVNAERVSLWQVAQHDRMITEEAHRLSRELSTERARRERYEKALRCAFRAIEDAIYTEEGLDGEAGQRVQHIILEAMIYGTFDQYVYGSIPLELPGVALQEQKP